MLLKLAIFEALELIIKQEKTKPKNNIKLPSLQFLQYSDQLEIIRDLVNKKNI